MVYKTLSTDFYYENSGITSLSYYITADNGTIYTGRAFNPNGIKINVRKAIDDWLVNEMPDFREYDGVMVEHEDAFKVFGLRSSDGTLLEEYGVFLTYEDNWLSEVTYRGIDGKADPRQKIFVGVLSDSPVDVDLYYDGKYFAMGDATIGASGGTLTIPYFTNYTEGEYYITVQTGLTLVSYGNGNIVVIVPRNTGASEVTYLVEAHRTSDGVLLDTATITQAETTPISSFLTFNIASDGVIGWRGGAEHHSVYYRKNGGNWIEQSPAYDPTPPGTYSPSFISVQSGDTLQFKAVHDTYNKGTGYVIVGMFSGSTATYDVQGNIMSLIHGDYFDNNSEFDYEPGSYSTTLTAAFRGEPVRHANKLVLPAVNVPKQAYRYMFKECTSLLDVPTIMGVSFGEETCYEMFNGCTSITKTPEIHATSNIGVYAFGGAFSGCTSLVEFVGELSGSQERIENTHTGNNFASMFIGCVSLSVPPQLPQTDLAYGAYASMFRGCTSLETAPVLPANHISLYGYQNMFYGCTSLMSVTCYATSVDGEGSISTRNWMYDILTYGTFTRKTGSTIWVSGIDGIPVRWTIIDG